MLSVARVRFLFRVAFFIYAPIFLAGTHWPQLEAPGGSEVALMAHVVGFGLWTGLLMGAGFFGPALSWRNIGVVFVIAVVYSALAEATQAIPFIRRHATFVDFVANLVGVSLACAGAVVLMKVWRHRTGSSGHEAATGSDPTDAR